MTEKKLHSEIDEMMREWDESERKELKSLVEKLRRIGPTAEALARDPGFCHDTEFRLYEELPFIEEEIRELNGPLEPLSEEDRDFGLDSLRSWGELKAKVAEPYSERNNLSVSLALFLLPDLGVFKALPALKFDHEWRRDFTDGRFPKEVMGGLSEKAYGILQKIILKGIDCQELPECEELKADVGRKLAELRRSGRYDANFKLLDARKLIEERHGVRGLFELKLEELERRKAERAGFRRKLLLLLVPWVALVVGLSLFPGILRELIRLLR